VRFGESRAWPAHDQGICALAWSPAGDRLASGGNDGAVLVWEPGGRRLAGPPGRHRGSVRGVDWAPDGGRLVTCGEDAETVVWDTAGWRVLARHAGHARWVNAVAWAPDGGRYASASGDGTLLVYDARDHRLEGRLEGRQGPVLSCCWSPDSSLLAAATWGGVIGVWRAGGWRLERRIRLLGSAWSVAWTPDGTGLLSGGEDGRAALWDVGTGLPRWAAEGHGDTVARVTVGIGGGVVASLGHDEAMALWRAGDGRPLDRVTGTYPGWAGCLTFHPRRPLLAGTDRSGRSITLWRIESGEAAGPANPALAHARDRLRAERARRAWAVDLGPLAAEVGAWGGLSGDPARAVRAAALQARARGEVVLSGDGRRAYLQAAAVARAADRLTEAPAGDGLVRLRDLPGELAGETPGPGAVGLAIAHHLLGTGRGWLQRDGGEPALGLPAAAARALPAELAAAAAAGTRWRVAAGARWSPAPFVRLVNTTLFARCSLFDGALCAEDGGGRIAVLAWPRGSSELALRVWPGDGQHLVAGLVDAVLDDLDLRATRLDGAGAAAAAGPPPDGLERLPWRPWASGAPDGWPLSLGDEPAPTVASLLERLRDEEARQLRLLARIGRDGPEPADVMLCHMAADRERAREIRTALGGVGLDAWIDEHGELEGAAPAPALLGLAERVGAIAVLVGRGAAAEWREQPFHPLYRALAEERPPEARRLRWLPIVLPEAPARPRLPDFLHSFDWVTWRDEPAAARRESLVHAVAAVTRDRARL